MADPDAPNPPLTPDDFYFNEDGLMVFTETYLRKRGFCCRNGCKHCPYGFRRGENPPNDTEGEDSL